MDDSNDRFAVNFFIYEFFIIKKVMELVSFLSLLPPRALRHVDTPAWARPAHDGSPIRGPYGPLSNGPYGSRPYGRREDSAISPSCYRLEWALYCPRSAVAAYKKLRKNKLMLLEILT
jgi:hypothetical protein